MHYPHSHADPPHTLKERLRQLNENLQALGERLKNSIATVIGATIAEAVKDAIRRLLGLAQPGGIIIPPYGPEPWYDDRNSRWERDGVRGWDREDRGWNREQEDYDDGWDRQDNDYRSPDREPEPATNEQCNRWRNAWTSGLQTALWWLKYQPSRRPVLATITVTLAAGFTAFVAGPVFAAGVGVLASIASLLLTADATKSAAELASG
jgi:hypothetical protein